MFEFFEEGVVGGREVEAGFPFHPGFEFGRDGVEEVGEDIDGHEVVTDIALVDLDRAEE